MRLLLVSTLYPPHVVGGAERSTALLAETLAASGHDVTVASLTPGDSGTRYDRKGVHVRTLPLRGRHWPFEGEHSAASKLWWHLRDVYDPAVRADVESILDDVNPDVLHTNTLSGFSVAPWLAASRRKIPIVHTLRDYYLLCPRNAMFRGGAPCRRQCLDCRFLSMPKMRATNRVHTVVGNSAFILDLHRAYGLFDRASDHRVVFNAHAAGRAPSEDAGRAASPVAGAMRFGYLGRLAPSKGVEYLLDAARTLPPEGWTLAIAGRGREDVEAALRTRAGHNVEFAGFVDPDAFLQRIDVLVVPSLWHEPLPRTIYEAYAHGVPVLSSDRGGSSEIVEPEGTGHVFDPSRGVDALAGLMRDAIERPDAYRGMRARCLDRARDFLPARMVAAYVDAYDRARGARRSHAGRRREGP